MAGPGRPKKDRTAKRAGVLLCNEAQRRFIKKLEQVRPAGETECAPAVLQRDVFDHLSQPPTGDLQSAVEGVLRQWRLTIEGACGGQVAPWAVAVFVRILELWLEHPKLKGTFPVERIQGHHPDVKDCLIPSPPRYDDRKTLDRWERESLARIRKFAFTQRRRIKATLLAKKRGPSPPDQDLEIFARYQVGGLTLKEAANRCGLHLSPSALSRKTTAVADALNLGKRPLHD